MIVGVLEVVFQVPGSSSLKDKRQVVRSLKDRIRRKFNVSLAEVEGQENWQLCGLAFSMVSSQQAAIEREFQLILDIIDSNPK